MSILNYTTKIDVEKTIGEIQKALSSHGASAILTDYENGVVKSISFQITMDGQKVGYRLPTDYEPILRIMKNDKKVPKSLCTVEQAVRVAWRIIKDWIVAQMAIIDTQMVQTSDVFLPYMLVKGNITLAEKIKSEPEFLLGDGNK